jgi:hypothetical protein
MADSGHSRGLRVGALRGHPIVGDGVGLKSTAHPGSKPSIECSACHADDRRCKVCGGAGYLPLVTESGGKEQPNSRDPKTS